MSKEGKKHRSARSRENLSLVASHDGKTPPKQRSGIACHASAFEVERCKAFLAMAEGDKFCADHARDFGDEPPEFSARSRQAIDNSLKHLEALGNLIPHSADELLVLSSVLMKILHYRTGHLDSTDRLGDGATFEIAQNIHFALSHLREDGSIPGDAGWDELIMRRSGR